VILLEESMRRFVEEADRGQWTLCPNASMISLTRATLTDHRENRLLLGAKLISVSSSNGGF
jgi:hypothetical protein